MCCQISSQKWKKECGGETAYVEAIQSFPWVNLALVIIVHIIIAAKKKGKMLSRVGFKREKAGIVP